MSAVASVASEARRDDRVEVLQQARRMAGRLCHRSGIQGADAEDCASWVQMRIIENGYEILDKFREESGFRSYLAAVVANLVRDYRDKMWGKWRPSAAAKRFGPLAVRLEVLVVRDGLELSSAAERLRSEGYPELTDRQAAEILASFPRRTRPHFESAEALAFVAAPERADHRLLDGRRRAAVQEAVGAVRSALDELPEEDRAIVELRFGEGLSVADVARALGLEQKPLYRRIERILAAVRSSPHTEDVSVEDLWE